MKLTVGDVLELEAFNRFELAAGSKGLSREIKSVGMLDYELGDMVDKNFGPGELVVSTLVGIKDDLSQLEDIVKRLIKGRTAGFAIKRIYLDEVPASVVKLCDEAAYPLFLFDVTFFELLITGVNDALKAQGEQDEQEGQIDRLLTADMNKYGIRKAAMAINRSFKDCVHVAYVQGTYKASPTLMASLNGLSRSMRCFTYKKGYLIIASSDLDQPQLSEGLLKSALAFFPKAEVVIGYSESGLKLEKLDVAIHEALFASEAAQRYQVSELRYPELGLDRLLMPVKDNPWVMAYYESIVDPILHYDLKNGTELMKTAVVFILSGGDIKIAANRLYQHGNTIRYRMDRVRQIIMGEDAPSSSYMSFYEVLASAVRLHLIYTGETDLG